MNKVIWEEKKEVMCEMFACIREWIYCDYSIEEVISRVENEFEYEINEYGIDMHKVRKYIVSKKEEYEIRENSFVNNDEIKSNFWDICKYSNNEKNNNNNNNGDKYNNEINYRDMNNLMKWINSNVEGDFENKLYVLVYILSKKKGFNEEEIDFVINKMFKFGVNLSDYRMILIYEWMIKKFGEDDNEWRNLFIRINLDKGYKIRDIARFIEIDYELEEMLWRVGYID